MKIAVLYVKGKESQTVDDHISSFQEYSSYNITYFDIFTQNITLEILNSFDVVVIHYLIPMFDESRMSVFLLMVLRNTRAKKIVFIQDEQRFVNKTVERLVYIKIDAIYTLLLKENIEKLYPDSLFPHTLKITTLAGYIPKRLLIETSPSYSDRFFDVVYRTRKPFFWWGRLGQKKIKIADFFSDYCQNNFLKFDISYEQKDILYGKDWINFLKNSKSALGCEGGTSIFDFTGEIKKECEQYEKEHSNPLFEDITHQFLGTFEGNVINPVITPRCFEYASCRTLMILYEGYYSGILKPWRHYVPLKEDHSNIEEVLAALKDFKTWKRITECAYSEIANNDKYSYKVFIQEFDRVVKRITLSSFLYPINSYNVPIARVEKIAVDPFKVNFIFYILKITSYVSYLIKKNLPSQRLQKKYTTFCNRIFMSLQVLYKLFKKKQWTYCFAALRKDFCIEFYFLNDVLNYIQTLENKVGIKPFRLSVNKDKICLLIDPEVEVGTSQREIKKNNNLWIVVSDSCGVPDNIRGKELISKYPLFVEEMLGL